MKKKKQPTFQLVSTALEGSSVFYFYYLLPQVKPPKLLQTLTDSEEAALVFVMFENVELRQIRKKIELWR